MHAFKNCVLSLSILLLVSSVFSVPHTNGTHRIKRSRFFNLISGLLSGGVSDPYCGNSNNCPLHHCRVDDTVIHGYCCGCARVTDRVPIRCPYHIRCPSRSQPLCSEYDYMMDCCC